MKHRFSIDRTRNLRMIRRRLVSSFLDMLILSKLRQESMSGYDILSVIRREFDILVGTGSIYNLLYRLERDGLIVGAWNERRRIYKLTLEGEAVAETLFGFCRKIEVFIRLHPIVI